MVTRQSLSGGP